MDFSPTAATAPALRPLRWRRLLPVLLLAAYAVWLWPHVEAVAGGSDSSGYFNHARMLAAGATGIPQRVIPGLPPTGRRQHLYQPLGFDIRPDRPMMEPSYPVGFPLMLAAAAPFVGWNHAGAVVILLHALAGVVLMYALARSLGLSVRWACLGTAILGLSPLYLEFALQAMSDLPATVWTTAAVWLAWRSRERPAWALGAGLATALAVLIRPTDVFVLLPVALALGWSLRRWLFLALGGLPGAIFLFLHNHTLYGRILTTGYGDVSDLFAAHWIPRTLGDYLLWLPALFTPVVLLAAGLPWLVRRLPRQTAVLAAWILPFLAFYSAYACTHEVWWYLRFVLPAAPALIVSGLLVARAVADRWRPSASPARLTVFAFAAVALNATVWNVRLDTLAIGLNEAVYPATAAWINRHLPANATVAASQMTGSLVYYTHLPFLRFDNLDPADLPHVLAALEANHQPLYAVLWPEEVEPALCRQMPGVWTKLAVVRDVTVWRRDPGGAAPVRLQPAGVKYLGASPPQLWRLPIEPTPAPVHGLAVLNALAWVGLAVLLASWGRAYGWRGWLAAAGVLLSAGALDSLRLGTTDLIALLALAAALTALERNRPGRAAISLAAAGLAGDLSLVGLPCLWRKSRTIAANAGWAVLAAAPLALWMAAGARWPRATWTDWPQLDAPFHGLTDKIGVLAYALRDDRASFITLITALIMAGLVVQAAYFLRALFRRSGPWWRLGSASMVALCLLGTSLWQYYAGDAARALLPLTLAFNRLAAETRAALAWLLVGNLAVIGGLLSLGKNPAHPYLMAPVQAEGAARLVLPAANWSNREHDDRHEWVWSRAQPRFRIETAAGDERTLQLDFDLQSLIRRPLTILIDGHERWHGPVDPTPVHLSTPVTLHDGRAIIDLVVPPADGSSPPAASLRGQGLALYDPTVRLGRPAPARP